MKAQRFHLWIGLLAVIFFRGYSQEAGKPNQEPFELPEFIITGKAEIGIPTYQKPLPHPPALLSAQALAQQFYSLEKIPPPPLPMPKFPTLQPLPAPARGFLNAAIGLFPTVSLRGTYQFHWQGFQWRPSASAEFSKGHQPNAGYTTVHLSLGTQRSGSFPVWQTPYRLRGDTRLALTHYRLYALDTAPQRRSIFVRTQWQWSSQWFSLPYQLQWQWRWWGLQQDGIRKEWLMTLQAQAGLSPALSLPLSLRTALTFGNSFGASIALATIAAQWQTVIDHALQLQAIAGIQAGQAAVNRAVYPLLHVAAAYRASPDWSATASVRWQLQPEWQWEWWQKNPYVSLTSATLLTAPLRLKLQGQYHPATTLSLAAAATLDLGRLGTWTQAQQPGTFDRRYTTATIAGLKLLWHWDITSSLRCNGVLTLQWSEEHRTHTILPFTPAVRGELAVTYRWNEQFAATALLSTRSALYTGNEQWLPAYGMLSLRGHYRPAPLWELTLALNNLLDAPLYEWNGYRKRGVYGELQLRRTLK